MIAQGSCERVKCPPAELTVCARKDGKNKSYSNACVAEKDGAAVMLRDKLSRAGLSEAEVLRFPADGKTRYAHFRSYLGWNPTEASLEEVSPHARPIARFPDLAETARRETAGHHAPLIQIVRARSRDERNLLLASLLAMEA